MFKSFKKSTSNQSNQNSQQDQVNLKQQRTLSQLRCKRDDLEKIIEEYWQRIDKLDKVIKEHISANRKIAAKGCIAEIQSLKKQIEIHHTKVNVIIKMIIDVETIDQDNQLSNVMKEATGLFQQQEEFNEQLNNNLESWQEAMTAQQERDQLFKDMDSKFNNLEEIDETLKQYEQEIELEKLTKQLNTVPSQQINAVKVSLPTQINNSKRQVLMD